MNPNRVNLLSRQLPCTESLLYTTSLSRARPGKHPRPLVTRPCSRMARRTFNPKPKPPPPSTQKRGWEDGWRTRELRTSGHVNRVIFIQGSHQCAACNMDAQEHNTLVWDHREDPKGKPFFFFPITDEGVDPLGCTSPSTFLLNNLCDYQSLRYKSNNSMKRRTPGNISHVLTRGKEIPLSEIHSTKYKSKVFWVSPPQHLMLLQLQKKPCFYFPTVSHARSHANVRLLQRPLQIFFFFFRPPSEAIRSASRACQRLCATARDACRTRFRTYTRVAVFFSSPSAQFDQFVTWTQFSTRRHILPSPPVHPSTLLMECGADQNLSALK